MDHSTVMLPLMKPSSATRLSAAYLKMATAQSAKKSANKRQTTVEQQQLLLQQQQSNVRSISLPTPAKETPTNEIVNQKFLVGHKIGNGNFGEIRRGQNTVTKQIVAIKFENKSVQTKLLGKEFAYYKMLGSHDGIPETYFYGECGSNNALVMEMLGESLEDLFDLCNRKFTEKTVCMIAIQILRIMEFVHSRDLIYRDIKPENFLIGLQEANKHKTVHIIDFGLAKEYKDPVTKKHIPYRENKNLTGTARYMSINTHLGREQSRRDDLEAIGHMLCYFLRGSLPWQGIKEEVVKVKYQKIGETKQKTSLTLLTSGFPKEFHDYLEYSRGLRFEETPNYGMLIKKFENLMTSRNWWKYDDKNEVIWDFDWCDKLKSRRSARPITTEALKKTYDRVVQGFNYNNASTEAYRGKISLLNDTKKNTINNNTNISNNNNNSNINNNNIMQPIVKPIIDASLLRREPTFCKILKEKIRTKFSPNIYNKAVKGDGVTATVINSTVGTSNERIATISQTYMPGTRVNHNYNLDHSFNNNKIPLFQRTTPSSSQKQRITALISTSNEKFNYNSSPNFCYNFSFRDSNNPNNYVSNSLYGNFDKLKNT